MRPRFQPPMNRRYFHKKHKIDKKDMAYLKKKIEFMKQKKKKDKLEVKDKKKIWYR